MQLETIEYVVENVHLMRKVLSPVCIVYVFHTSEIYLHVLGNIRKVSLLNFLKNTAIKLIILTLSIVLTCFFLIQQSHSLLIFTFCYCYLFGEQKFKTTVATVQCIHIVHNYVQ